MHLHRLELCAIGPFADTFSVDFDALGASGLFLLEGPTGAGKSTLIDAVVFALYGQVAGADSSAERLHSDVAPDDRTPYVQLDFSTARGLYRVRRTPKHQRPSRRGDGTVTENASARLWRLLEPAAASDPGALGEPVAVRVEEVGREIVDAIGLSREQFTQTIVLPQGEFAAFLRSDPEVRRRLLQRLFGTEVYDRVVARLEDQRKRAKHQRAEAAAAVAGAVRAFSGAAGVEGDDEADLVAVADADDALTRAVDQHVAMLRVARNLAETQAAGAESSASEARDEVGRRRRSAEARERVVHLRRGLAELDARREELETDVLRLQRADHARPLVPLLDGLTQAERRHAEAVAELERVRSSLPDTEPSAWPQLEREARDLVAGLVPAVRLEAGLTAQGDELAACRARHEETRRRLRGVDESLALAPDRLRTLRDQLRDAVGRCARLDGASADLAAASEAVSAAERLEQLRRELASACAAREVAHQRAQRAADVAREVHRRFLDGIAGHLAEQLRDGEPCLVCGSSAHPQPAARRAGDVDRAAVDTSTAEATAAERALLDAVARTDELERQVNEAPGSVAVTADDARLRVRNAEQAVADLAVATADASRLQVELDAAEAEIEEQRATSAKLQAELARLQSEVDTTADRLERDTAAVIDLRAGHPCVQDRIDELTREASRLAVAGAAARTVDAASSDVRTRAQQWQVALEASPLADRAEVLDARLDEGERRELAGRVEQTRRRRTEIEAELASPGLIDVDLDAEVDVDAAEQQLIVAESVLHTAQKAHAGLRQRVEDAEQRALEVAEALAERQQVHEQTAPLIRLADLAGGIGQDNARSMSLPAFVLRERFAEVVSSANERLAVMSEGRYTLEHVEDRQGAKRAGLGLRVRDTHTDQPRDPRSLSGGETFYCSLALALGLADVVSAEAGGVDLGTLFVDEGFGSLDAETLDQVLVVLSGLTTSGRTVGVVSHVPELKERIGERVTVVKNRDGSSRLVVSA